MVKVGRSRDPLRRVGHANTWCPEKLYALRHYEFFDDCITAESVIHSSLSDVRSGATEWFQMETEDAVALISTIHEEIKCLPAPSY